jgi:hypothetical protein
MPRITSKGFSGMTIRLATKSLLSIDITQPGQTMEEDMRPAGELTTTDCPISCRDNLALFANSNETKE